MKLRDNNKGLTLIELIVALTIISIVATSFLVAFSDGFSIIVLGGNKSRASIKAQEILDHIYAEAEFTDKAELRQVVSELIDGVSFEDYSDKVADFTEPNISTDIRFYVSEPQNLLIQNDVYSVTLSVYYDNYKRYVTITSPVLQ